MSLQHHGVTCMSVHASAANVSEDRRPHNIDNSAGLTHASVCCAGSPSGLTVETPRHAAPRDAAQFGLTGLASDGCAPAAVAAG